LHARVYISGNSAVVGEKWGVGLVMDNPVFPQKIWVTCHTNTQVPTPPPLGTFPVTRTGSGFAYVRPLPPQNVPNIPGMDMNILDLLDMITWEAIHEEPEEPEEPSHGGGGHGDITINNNNNNNVNINMGGGVEENVKLPSLSKLFENSTSDELLTGISSTISFYSAVFTALPVPFWELFTIGIVGMIIAGCIYRFLFK